MIEGVEFKELKTYTDERGYFREVLRASDPIFTERFAQWSHTMSYTGVLILIFVIFHLLKFTFVDKTVTPIYQQMAATFAQPSWVLFYVVAMVIVAIHISHGFWSMFQTFGINHPRYMPLIMRLGLVVTLVFGFGFGILPIYLLIIA